MTTRHTGTGLSATPARAERTKREATADTARSRACPRTGAGLAVGVLGLAALSGCASTGSVGEIPANPPPVLVGRVHSVADWGLRLQVGDGKPQTLGWADGFDTYRQVAGAPSDLRVGDCVSFEVSEALTADRTEATLTALYLLGRTTDGTAVGAPASECALTMRQASAPGRIAGTLTGTGTGEPLSAIGLVEVLHRAGQGPVAATTAPTGVATSRTVPGWPTPGTISLPVRLTLRLGGGSKVWATAKASRSDIVVGTCATVAVTRQFGLPAAGRITLHPDELGVCGRVSDDSAVLVPISVWSTPTTSTGPTTVPSLRPRTSGS